MELLLYLCTPGEFEKLFGYLLGGLSLAVGRRAMVLQRGVGRKQKAPEVGDKRTQTR